MIEIPKKLYQILHSKCMASRASQIKDLSNNRNYFATEGFLRFSEYQLESSYVERDGKLYLITDANVPLVAGKPAFQLIDMGG